MACTCFSQDNVTCDHQRKNADDWTIELTDDSDDIVVELPDTKNQDTFVVELSDDDDPMAAVMRASRARSHKDDDWSITITDDAQDDDTITIDDSVLQELATEVKAKTCPKADTPCVPSESPYRGARRNRINVPYVTGRERPEKTSMMTA